MARITTPREESRADPWPPPAPIAVPLRLHEGGRVVGRVGASLLETHLRHLGEARLVSG